MTCRQAAELISRELDTSLPLQQRGAVRFHAFVCVACRRFRRQISAIHGSVEQLFATETIGGETALLPPAAKEHLRGVVLFHLNGES